MNNKIKIAFDMDDVICKRPKKYEYLGEKKYEYCKPIKKNIKIINNLHEKNFYIIIYTSRGMTQFKSNLKLVKRKLNLITKNQLKKWEVKYDKLYMGKVHYDLLIDDKAINSKSVNISKILRFLKKNQVN